MVKNLKNYRVNKDLKISGSATINPKSLKEVAKLAKKIKAVLYVYDLRQESHGLINDQPVTWESERDWANADLNHEEAIRRERRLLGDLRVGEKVAGAEIKSIETEESMVRGAGHQYVRLTIRRSCPTHRFRGGPLYRVLKRHARKFLDPFSRPGRQRPHDDLYDSLRYVGERALYDF